MSFDSFITNISPGNSSAVSVSGNEIRNTITSKSNIISGSSLTGSYVRYTKIDPIDDLDIFFDVNFSNTCIEKTDDGIKIYITSDYYEHQLKDFTVYENSKYYVSPIKLINHIGKLVKETYTTTNEQSRNGECYTVYLSSKGLTIDCVPYTGVNNEDYKLIPKGGNNLYWKKTNPDIDKNKINELNNSYDGKLKGVIKIMKFWNTNKNTGVKFKSYILECLVYFAFINKCSTNMSYLDLILKTVEYIYNNVHEHRHISDLPRYEYMYYYLDNSQRSRVKSKLKDFYDKLKVGEYTAISYLEN